MPAEHEPPEQVAFYGRPLVWLTRLSLRYPVATIALATGLAIVSLVYTSANLGYRTNRLDLVNPNNDYNRLWRDYANEFGDEDDAVVVVEGANRDKVVPVLQEISTLLAREDQLFHAVLHGVNLEKIRGKGLHYLSSEELLGVERFLSEVSPIVDGNWSRLNLGHMTAGMCMRLEMAGRNPALPEVQAAGHELERLSDSLLATLSQRRQYQSPWPEMPQSFATLSELSAEYLLTNEGQLGFVLLRLAPGKDGFARCSEATDALRSLIAQIGVRHPETKIGLTGLPIMENDEMRSSQAGMFWASVLSFVGVALLFVAGFGGIRHALLANLVLLLGMAWSFGYVTLSVGHLNILSVSFTATLIGIGIDYGIHYVARYLELRGASRDTKGCLLRTTAGVGPAIMTGALTTAVAFFAAGFTSFTGVAELGLIAGGGILICCAAELLVLPATIALVDRSGWGGRMPEPLAVHEWIEPLMRRPGRLLLSTCTLTVILGMGVGHLWYDHNLLNLQPVGLESVELERKLLAESNQSVWYAVSIADSREELLARKARLLQLKSVERTEEIVSLLPVDHEVKQPIIERIQKQLLALPERPPLIPVDRPEDLGRVLAKAQDLVILGQQARAARNFEQVRDMLRRLPLSDCYALLSHFQQQMAGDLLTRLYALRSMANPEPPQLSDLPESLVHRFVGQHDRHLLKIYGRGNIWDMGALAKFVKDVRSVDPRVTGNPLQAYEASLEMKTSYENSALYATVIILALLWFDFRSIPYALLAALPLAVGVLQMFGIMGLLNIPLNPANMIALPLILGISVDEGVHIVHDFREHRGRYRMAASTAVAVLVDALTTIVGYGALMIASHQGLQSLGRVLTIGVSCCMFTSLIMLPALLTWITRKRPDEEPEENAAGRNFGTGKGTVWRRDDAEHPGQGAHSQPAARPSARSVEL
jgi:hypothetical protein